MTGIRDRHADAFVAANDEGGEPKARTPVAAWYALAVLVMTTLFAFIDRQIVNLIAPSLQQSLGLSDFQIGALQGLGLALFASIASYPFGWLADRFGRRLLLCIGITIWSLATAACAFQNSFTGLFLGTVGIAVGEAGLAPIVFAMIPDLFPERRRNTANFIYFAASILGAAAGIALGGLALKWLASLPSLPSFLDGMESWRVALLLVAAPGPIFVALVAAIRVRGSASVAASSLQAPVHGLIPYARVHWRTLVCVFGAIAAYNLPLMSSFVWLPIAIPRIFGVPVAEVGMQMGMAMAMATIVGLSLPAIAFKWLGSGDGLQSIRISRMLMTAAIAPTALFSFATAPWHLYAAAAAQLACAIAVAAMMPGVLQQISPEHLRSRILSILGIVSAIAIGICPLLVGWISDRMDGPRGILAAIVVVGLPGWLGAVMLFSLARRPMTATIAAVRG